MATVYWPFPTSTVSEWPGQRTDSYHVGTDFAVPQGTPLKATVDGVIKRWDNDGLGAYVIDIIADDGLLVRNGHLSRMDVQTGQRVTAGQIIGLTGGKKGTPGAGNSTGPHLHWELRRDRLWAGGAWVDPRNMQPPVRNFGTAPTPSPEKKDDDMAYNRVRDPRNGFVAFADELGFDDQAQYLSPDIGGDEWNQAVAKVFGPWQELTAREFDLVSALVGRRSKAWLDKVTTEVAKRIGTVTVNESAIADSIASKLSSLNVNVDGLAQAIADKINGSTPAEVVTTKADILEAIEANYPEGA